MPLRRQATACRRKEHWHHVPGAQLRHTQRAGAGKCVFAVVQQLAAGPASLQTKAAGQRGAGRPTQPSSPTAASLVGGAWNAAVGRDTGQVCTPAAGAASGLA